jgi:hypothetical protein
MPRSVACDPHLFGRGFMHFARGLVVGRRRSAPSGLPALPEAGQAAGLVDVQRGDHDEYDDAQCWVYDVSAEGGGCRIVC